MGYWVHPELDALAALVGYGILVWALCRFFLGRLLGPFTAKRWVLRSIGAAACLGGFVALVWSAYATSKMVGAWSILLTPLIGAGILAAIFPLVRLLDADRHSSEPL